MTFEADLYSYLSTHADGTALRALVSTRIYWGTAPQDAAYPYIRISSLDGDPGFLLAGDDGRQVTRLQFSVFDRLHTACIAVREALRDLLHGQRITHGNTLFDSIRMTNTNEFWVDDTPEGYMHMPIDFQIFHRNN